MPLYRQQSKLGRRITIKGYEMVFSPASQRWIFTHMVSDIYNIKSGVYVKGKNEAIHHKDFNKLNNNPDNLVRMPKMDHFLFHTTQLEKTIHREDVKEKCRAIRQSEAFREKMSEIMLQPEMRKMLSARAKKQWNNKEYKQYMIEKFLEFYSSNKEYQKKNKQILQQAQEKYWSNPANKQQQSERVKKFFVQHPERKNQLSVLAKEQWENNELLDWRREATKKQWTPEFREKRKEAYNHTYLLKALRILHGLYEETNTINKDAYNKFRSKTNDKSLIRYETIQQRFFNGNEKRLQDAVIHFNHKIKKIIQLEEKIDVYDIEVPETHNFALASGVFVHNSGKQGRDRRYQAILPLRGKILNVEKARLDKMLANNEIKSLVIALGTAIGNDFSVEKIRYHKIVIMTDADVDGAHICTLLLTLFFRYFRSVIESGYLYIAQPPLYRVQAGKEIRYAYSDEEKEKVIGDIQKLKISSSAKATADKQKSKIVSTEEEERLEEGTEKIRGVSVQRYKGLGEMNPEQLWETTMNPETRVLKQVAIADAQEADRLFDVLMGEKVAPRKHFIQSRATTVKNLDI
jgi:DNA gyrase subunit B